MEMIKTNGFAELTTSEMNEIDGGLLGITLTLGAKIAIGLFAGGTLVGIGYGIWG